MCREFIVSTNNDKWTNKNTFTSLQNNRTTQIDSDSYARWIIEKSDGLTLVGISKISESAMMYVYVLLTAQVSAKSIITDNSSTSLQARKIWMDNFYEIINRQNNTATDIKMYQNVLKYASSKVDYNLGTGIYMIPSDMNLRIKRNIYNYNNKILISEDFFKIGYNIGVNIKPNQKLKPIQQIKPVKSVKSIQQIKPIEIKKVNNKIEINNKRNEHEEDKIASILGSTLLFTGLFFYFK